MVISLAIFGILMMLFTTLMGVAAQMRKNVFEQNRNSMKLVKELAEDRFKGSEQIEMKFNFNGRMLTIKGDLRNQTEGDVTYYVFEPHKNEVNKNE